VTTGCPQCGSAAVVVERFVLESTDGPQEHARTACPRGHRFVASIEALTRRSPGSVADAQPMRIMLLCSAFNGLTQRVWIELRAAGHEVSSWRVTMRRSERRWRRPHPTW